MPPSEHDIREHSGREISQLNALVDNTLALYRTKRQKEDWEDVANIHVRLADAMFVNGEPVENYTLLVQAYFDLAEIQDCLISGKTDECRHCGEWEGLHYSDQWCRKQPMLAKLANRFERKA